MADPIWQSIISIFQLNGPAMSHFLPMEAFKWVENIQQRMQKNPDFWRVNAENSEVGYILEVDIDYPSRIHNDHKDFSFLREHRDGKLMTTLYEKEKYVAHYTMLTQALDHGLKLQKIHRVLVVASLAIFLYYFRF